jgi:tetratricopeptide (TPR) repeat protein
MMLSRLRNLLKPKEAPGQTQPAAAIPISWEELFQQAQSLQQLGQLEQAIELYGKCVERVPLRA